MPAIIDLLIAILIDPWLLAGIFLIASIIGFRASLRLPPVSRASTPRRPSHGAG